MALGQNPIESYLPGVRDNGGLTTSEPAYFGGGLNGLTTVVSETTVATLTVAQSGSTILFNSTTGVLVTLPAPTVGLSYDFVVSQAPSAGTHGIKTNSASVFLIGGLNLAAGGGSTASGTTAVFTANGSSNVGLSFNGTTTGGLSGSRFNATCTSTTVWTITGSALASGNTLATPVY